MNYSPPQRLQICFFFVTQPPTDRDLQLLRFSPSLIFPSQTSIANMPILSRPVSESLACTHCVRLLGLHFPENAVTLKAFDSNSAACGSYHVRCCQSC